VRNKRLDILVNNAGIMIDENEKTVMDLSSDTLHATLATNAFGPFLLCQACTRLMQKNNYGFNHRTEMEEGCRN